MSLWSDLNFRRNPYTVAPLPATEEGERLLVGRDRELAQLAMMLSSSTTHPTIEGENGVGKTSLVAVAGYRTKRSFVGGSITQLLIPLPDISRVPRTASPPIGRRLPRWTQLDTAATGRASTDSDGGERSGRTAIPEKPEPAHAYRRP